MTPWWVNEHGHWCPSCGDRVAPIDAEVVREDCRQCGYPDAERVADYHLGSDDDDDQQLEDDLAGEECGRWINGRLGTSCLLAGTEFCDWECPYS